MLRMLPKNSKHKRQRERETRGKNRPEGKEERNQKPGPERNQGARRGKKTGGGKRKPRREERKGRDRARNQGGKGEGQGHQRTNSKPDITIAQGNQNPTLAACISHSSRTFGRPLKSDISKVLPRVKNIDSTHGIALQTKPLASQ